MAEVLTVQLETLFNAIQFSPGTEFGGFRCSPGTAHLQCQGCGGLMPSRPNNGVPQHCNYQLFMFYQFVSLDFQYGASPHINFKSLVLFSLRYCRFLISSRRSRSFVLTLNLLFDSFQFVQQYFMFIHHNLYPPLMFFTMLFNQGISVMQAQVVIGHFVRLIGVHKVWIRVNLI